MSLVMCSSDAYECLKIEDQVIDFISSLASQWYPDETGGILLGYYDTNYRFLTISVASPPPPDSKHGRMSFNRGTKGISKLIKWGIKQSTPLCYVGEWHTHPDAKPKPSGCDLRQMQDFSLRNLYGSTSPVLLIVGGSLSTTLEWRATVHYPKLPYRTLYILD